MSSRCPNGTRRCPPKTGKCSSAKNKTAKSRSPSPAKSRSPSPAKIRSPSPTKPPVSFIEFCKTAAELYGLKYSFCRKNGTMREIYHANRDKSNIVYPKTLNMIGTPYDADITRHPFNKMALKSKTGITANVIVK